MSGFNTNETVLSDPVSQYIWTHVDMGQFWEGSKSAGTLEENSSRWKPVNKLSELIYSFTSIKRKFHVKSQQKLLTVLLAQITLYDWLSMFDINRQALLPRRLKVGLLEKPTRWLKQITPELSDWTSSRRNGAFTRTS